MLGRSAATAISRRLACVGIASLTMLAGMLVAVDTAEAATAVEASAGQSVLQLMNAQRAAHNLPALGWSTALVASSRQHNLAMAKANVLSHQLPNEAVFSTRISQAGVPWHAAAENIGWTSDRTAAGANALQTSMYNETPPNDGHRLNILSTSLHFVGIDIYIDAATGKLWLTEDFADVAGPKPVVAAVPQAVVTSHAPIGNLDSAVVLPGHKVRLTGWAMDPDSKATPLFIAVFWDGHFGGYYRVPYARPDVVRAKGGGPNQGYSFTITLPPGVHAITTCGVNVGAGHAMTRLSGKRVKV